MRNSNKKNGRLLSIVIPLYNEEENVLQLFKEISYNSRALVVQGLVTDYEIIFINDGSRDNTQKNLIEVKKISKNKVRIIEFRKNFGQTAALKAGFVESKGDIIITMDGDLQNDPADMKNIIKKLDEGYDVVSGWRWQRHDPAKKLLVSRIMNRIRRKLIGDKLHDYGCSLKIYRRDCIKDLQLFGELHRYITAYLFIKGYKIAEIKVNHRPRKAGITKYKNIGRGINGLLDLFFLKFWASFSDRPLHFFGRIGIYQWAIAILITIEQIIKFIFVGKLTFGPFMALALLLVITGLLFIIFGFLSEMITRIYFKDETTYSIKEII
ncbi:glycosyltransferase family 2 protein [Candidatus Pacearchaeota archaeon]|nr:glycosyltransferase family 2 protein [Candidatus Pacearchaeota archaeon]